MTDEANRRPASVVKLFASWSDTRKAVLLAVGLVSMGGIAGTTFSNLVGIPETVERHAVVIDSLGKRHDVADRERRELRRLLQAQLCLMAAEQAPTRLNWIDCLAGRDPRDLIPDGR